jgi:hypothetical protein
MTLDNEDSRLPKFVRDLLANPPDAGNGVHDYLFRVALKLHPYRTDEEIYAWLREFGNGCGRYVPDREIEDAIENSREFAWQGGAESGQPTDTGNGKATGSATPRTPPWPQPDVVMIEDICREGIPLAALHADSPVKIDGRAIRAEEVIDAMFPGDPWLCCGAASHDFSTKRHSEWRGCLADQSFIVPSAMLGRYGFTKDGRVSEHAQSAVGPRQYLVVEFDFALKSRDGLHDTALAPLIRRLDACNIKVADMCAALLAHLARFAPLALVVHSGGKSLHGWFPCAGIPEDELRGFMHFACQLGADPKTWSPSLFVRMPDGTRRDHGKEPRRQHICFWNPEALSHA